MIRRHREQLMARLDELYANGTTFISYNELYHWYNIRRIAKAPWRDIKSRWEALLEEKEQEYSDPQIAELPGGVSFFFCRHPGTLSKLAK